MKTQSRNFKLSIIIPAHNEEDVIGRAIKSILYQEFSSLEIVVINDGSTDSTKSIVQDFQKRFKNIILKNYSSGHSAAFARNRGAEIARGKILVFLDADASLGDKFIKELSMNSELADAYLTKCLPKRTTFFNGILSSMIDASFKFPIAKAYFTKNSKSKPLVFCFKRKVFMDIGGFNEDIFYFEDEDITQRFYNKGYRAVFLPDAEQYFELPASFKEFARQTKWIGRGINTLPNKSIRNRARARWIMKTIFLLFPLALLFNPAWSLAALLITALTVYILLLLRNRSLFKSILAIPITYIKTFLVTYNMLKFWRN